jgi:hypothetical protein
MKIHHLTIFIFKMLFLLLLVLVKLKIFPQDTAFENIIDYTFKLLLGIFVLYVSFPWRKNFYSIEGEDLIFLFMSGILFLFTIDYKKYLNSFKIFFHRIRTGERNFSPIGE